MIGRVGMKKILSSCLPAGPSMPTTRTAFLMMSERNIHRSGLDNPNMSQTVIHNGIVYISGQVPDFTDGDIVEQTENVLSKIDSLLEGAGTDKSKLLTANIWVKNIDEDFQGMNSVWSKWIDPENKPVRATGKSYFEKKLSYSILTYKTCELQTLTNMYCNDVVCLVEANMAAPKILVEVQVSAAKED